MYIYHMYIHISIEINLYMYIYICNMYTCIFRERERAGSSYQQNPKPANKNPPKKRAHISRRLGIICNIPPPSKKAH